MLSFCINYLSPANQLVYDQELKCCYLLIYKNGTRSLLGMCKKDPDRFLNFIGADSTNFLRQHQITTLAVLIRDPIERFFSGLVTQALRLKIDIKEVFTIWENTRPQDQDTITKTINIFDIHTVPQFWFLLRSTQLPELKFNILPLSSLSNIYPASEKINVHPDVIKVGPKDVSAELLHKIDYFFTEDIVLYNQFQNKITDLESIIKQIRLEKNFTEEYRSYYKMLTYL